MCTGDAEAAEVAASVFLLTGPWPQPQNGNVARQHVFADLLCDLRVSRGVCLGLAAAVSRLVRCALPVQRGSLGSVFAEHGGVERAAGLDLGVVEPEIGDMVQDRGALDVVEMAVAQVHATHG
jgi:hypothetical protein